MQLKKSFRVRGSKTLIEAFAKELEILGLTIEGMGVNDSIGVYKHGTYHMNYPYNCMNHLDESYTLPQDWDKALAAAQNYEEEKIEYVKCVTATHPETWTIGKIYKVKNHIYKSDTYIPLIGDDGESKEVIDWLYKGNSRINTFEPSTEAEYLSQESKIKAGDWVVVTDDSNEGEKGNWSGKKKGDMFLVGHVTKSSIGTISSWVGTEDRDKGDGISIKQVRKATEEEIKKATEIKVGNIVVCISNTTDSPQGAGYKSGLVFTVTEIQNTSSGLCYFGGKDYNGVYSSWIRKATPQEIEAAQTIKISGYASKVENGKIAFGCQQLSKQTLQELQGVAAYVEIQIGDTKITQDLLTKLINKL